MGEQVAYRTVVKGDWNEVVTATKRVESLLRETRGTVGGGDQRMVAPLFPFQSGEKAKEEEMTAGFLLPGNGEQFDSYRGRTREMYETGHDKPDVAVVNFLSQVSGDMPGTFVLESRAREGKYTLTTFGDGKYEHRAKMIAEVLQEEMENAGLEATVKVLDPRTDEMRSG